LLITGDRFDEPGRAYNPADSKRRCERLADRTQGNHAIWSEALYLPDRLPIIAELGIVVVLNDRRAALLRPPEESEPPLGSQNNPGRRLMRGREHYSPRNCGAERINVYPMLVDRNRDSFQSRPGGNRAVVRFSWIFDRDSAYTFSDEGAEDEAESLCEP
jgi:hypothetical protein